MYMCMYISAVYIHVHTMYVCSYMYTCLYIQKAVDNRNQLFTRVHVFIAEEVWDLASHFTNITQRKAVSDESIEA